MEHDGAGRRRISYAGQAGEVRRREAGGCQEAPAPAWRHEASAQALGGEALAPAPGSATEFGWGMAAGEPEVRNLARAILWDRTGSASVVASCEELLRLALRAFPAEGFALHPDWIDLLLAHCRDPGAMPAHPARPHDPDELPQP